MTTIKVHGEGNNEATIVELVPDGDSWSYVCSKGMWCNRQNEIRAEGSMADAIGVADVHVARHDREDVERINS